MVFSVKLRMLKKFQGSFKRFKKKLVLIRSAYGYPGIGMISPGTPQPDDYSSLQQFGEKIFHVYAQISKYKIGFCGNIKDTEFLQSITQDLFTLLTNIPDLTNKLAVSKGLQGAGLDHPVGGKRLPDLVHLADIIRPGHGVAQAQTGQAV